MSKWSKVVLLVLLVLVSAMALRNLAVSTEVAGTGAPVPPAPWLMAGTGAPVPPAPWLIPGTGAPVPPAPFNE